MSFLSDFFEQTVFQFRNTSALEWSGVITAIAGIYLAAKENILNWPVSILSSIIYAVVFYEYRLYGDAVLQLYFVATCVYGWYYWKQREQHAEKPIVRLSGKEWILTLTAIAILSTLLGLFLDHFTNSDVPYADGFCTALSFIAQFLMTRKILESWLLWIIVDICYVPLLLYKQLPSTSILYLILIILAIIGQRDWRKTWKATQEV